MIYLAPYRLHTVQPLNSQETNLHVDGVLLRHEDGVGCVQPWVSLGDRPLDEHLAHLARGHVTPLVARALDCCRWDGAARRAGVSLWAGVSIPASHATLAHAPTPAEIAELRAAGFTHLKLKAGRGDSALPQRLETLREAGFTLRLDFNQALDPATFREFATALSPAVKAQIDFIEDPFPYAAGAWAQAEAETGLTLALDRGLPSAPVAVGIWKPATTPAAPAAARTIITSNMDHAIGQLYAAACAAHARNAEVGGWLTHRLFVPDAFFSQLHSIGPALQAPSGPGLGFAAELDLLPWQRLSAS